MTYGTLCHAIGHQVLPNPPVIPQSLVDYHQVFKPILYFQPSPAQSDSRLHPTPPPFFTVGATDLREHFSLSDVFYLTLLIPTEAEDFP